MIHYRYYSDYHSRLIKLELLPLMYTFDLFDIVFILKSLKYPSPSFNIMNFITFNTNKTRSSAHGKLIHQMSSNNLARNFFFFRIPQLWDALPPIDLSQSVASNKIKITRFLWSHFTSNFNPNNTCTFQLVCPRNKCMNNPLPPNFTNQ